LFHQVIPPILRYPIGSVGQRALQRRRADAFPVSQVQLGDVSPKGQLYPIWQGTANPMRRSDLNLWRIELANAVENEHGFPMEKRPPTRQRHGQGWLGPLGHGNISMAIDALAIANECPPGSEFSNLYGGNASLFGLSHDDDSGSHRRDFPQISSVTHATASLSKAYHL